MAHVLSTGDTATATLDMHEQAMRAPIRVRHASTDKSFFFFFIIAHALYDFSIEAHS